MKCLIKFPFLQYFLLNTYSTLALMENPIYECLAPFRCLLIKRLCPNNWDVMQKMEQHTQVCKFGDVEYNIKYNTLNISGKLILPFKTT